MSNLCSFDCQVQCEEFYSQEMCFTPEELGLVEEEAVVVSFTQADEVMAKIQKYQDLWDDAVSYIKSQVDCDDIEEFDRVMTQILTYQEILDDLKSFSWVAEFFIDEEPKPRCYRCCNCPHTTGEEDVNGCSCGCALC